MSEGVEHRSTDDDPSAQTLEPDIHAEGLAGAVRADGGFLAGLVVTARQCAVFVGRIGAEVHYLDLSITRWSP